MGQMGPWDLGRASKESQRDPKEIPRGHREVPTSQEGPKRHRGVQFSDFFEISLKSTVF